MSRKRPNYLHSGKIMLGSYKEGVGEIEHNYSNAHVAVGKRKNKTKVDNARNLDISWKEAHMDPAAEFLRKKRLRWFGQVQRRNKDDVTRTILQMTVDGKRNRGRPNLSC